MPLQKKLSHQKRYISTCKKIISMQRMISPKKKVIRVLTLLSFGIGPAGTGKTYLAVACAVELLEREQVRRLVLVRPAVEAGERLGFLPGDLTQKVDPYLRPIYDALYEFLGFDRVAKLIDKNVIEVAPLAYMRGRTLNHSCVIMDEAQNTTVEQMKMFLTRIGFGSRAIVTGDVTQIDLPKHVTSGLKHVRGVLEGVDGIGFCEFKARDVVRHPLVQRIVGAYNKAESLDSQTDKRSLVLAALTDIDKAKTGVGITVRIVDSEEIRTSNKQWRGIDKATNVLSFPAEFPPEAGVDYLGDLLICAEVLQRESAEQNKSLNDHWAHIVIHGVLHLLGYDHENESDAIVMETREREILASLGVADPYTETEISS